MEYKRPLSLKEYIEKENINLQKDEDIINNRMNDGWSYFIREGSDQQLISLVHYKNNKLNNDNGPALIESFLENNKILSSIRYFKNGLLHRSEKPAILCYDSEISFDGKNFIPKNNSKPIELFWFRNGLRHNLNGPSYISFSLLGKEYYINDLFLSKEEFYKNKKVIDNKNKKEIKKKMDFLFINNNE